ncbi:MAG: pyruvate dehydrogenase (acetyl-transferring) E1 component subunit alpha [Flavisolibacter sp.]
METVLQQQKQDTVDKAHGQHLLRKLLLIRRFEEKCAEVYTQEKIRGFLHLYIGEEAVAVGVISGLQPDDNVLSTYREHGHALARGIDPGKIMAEMFGKQEGCSGGRGGSMHLFDKSKNFYGGNAIVAGHLPLALGMALASKKQKKKNITCCFFGEGAAAEGEFHEVMNLASLWQVPLLLVCENNRYAMGTALEFTHAIQQLELKGPDYGIETAAVDGMDVLAVEKVAQEAIAKVRTTCKPFFLVCNTYRYRAHSMFDAELYREKSEVEEWKKRDPIKGLQENLLAQNLLTENELTAIKNSVEEEVQQAVAFAENGTWEAVENLQKFVYSENNS